MTNRKKAPVSKESLMRCIQNTYDGFRDRGCRLKGEGHWKRKNT